MLQALTIPAATSIATATAGRVTSAAGGSASWVLPIVVVLILILGLAALMTVAVRLLLGRCGGSNPACGTFSLHSNPNWCTSGTFNGDESYVNYCPPGMTQVYGTVCTGLCLQQLGHFHGFVQLGGELLPRLLLLSIRLVVLMRMLCRPVMVIVLSVIV